MSSALVLCSKDRRFATVVATLAKLSPMVDAGDFAEEKAEQVFVFLRRYAGEERFLEALAAVARSGDQLLALAQANYDDALAAAVHAQARFAEDDAWGYFSRVDRSAVLFRLRAVFAWYGVEPPLLEDAAAVADACGNHFVLFRLFDYSHRWMNTVDDIFSVPVKEEPEWQRGPDDEWDA